MQSRRERKQLKERLVGGTKHDQNKSMVELIPWEGLEEVGFALKFGAKKYSPHNWRKGFAWSRLAGAALRHIYQWLNGEDKDPESGLSHLAHACACILMLLTHEKKGYGQDDRFKETKNS